MTKLETITIEQAKAVSADTMSLPGDIPVPAKDARPAVPAVAKVVPEMKHGPTTTMMSGWAQGGSSTS